MPPPKIVIVGSPNTGKSTLFNRLVGRREALVHREPGMTRDVHEKPCDWNGRPVVLVDTGGVLETAQPLLDEAIRRQVLRAIADAAVLILVVDGRAGLTAQDENLARVFRTMGHPIVLAINKIDSPGQPFTLGEFHTLGFKHVATISAAHDLGIEDLQAEVSEFIPGNVLADAAPEPAKPISLAIAGRPNVGKSSLLNALAGEDKVLVSDVPGTTRDAIDTLLAVGDRRYRIIDTAGLRRRGHVRRGPESLSVLSSRRRIQGADVVLIVMDCVETPTLQDLHVAGIAHDANRPFLVLLNKWDLIGRDRRGEELPERVRERLKFAPFVPILPISARTGLGIGRILPTVDQIHEQAMRRFSTGRLNAWLARAVARHAPSGVRGKEFKLYYTVQTGENPPAFLVFTNRSEPPHFSYRRYIENSLRESFDLSMTPVVVRYRKRPRLMRNPRGGAAKGKKRRV
ncbi:MAG: ribosome biogenesis GTPase Der [Acidobacteriota bacterium]